MPAHRLVLAAINVSAAPRSLDIATIDAAGIAHSVHIHSTTGALDVVDGRIELPGCGSPWVGDA